MFNTNEVTQVAEVKRFLVENEFNRYTADALESVAVLIDKSSRAAKLVLSNEYAEIAATYDSNENNVRSKLGYYIKMNYERVRNSVKAKHGYDIGEQYEGIKAFVEKMGIAYSLARN